MIFLLLLSLYHTPIPPSAFSHLLLVADPSVLTVTWHRLGIGSVFILAGGLSSWYGSLFFDLCPGIFLDILIPLSRLWFALVSGL